MTLQPPPPQDIAAALTDLQRFPPGASPPWAYSIRTWLRAHLPEPEKPPALRRLTWLGRDQWLIGDARRPVPWTCDSERMHLLVTALLNPGREIELPRNAAHLVCKSFNKIRARLANEDGELAKELQHVHTEQAAPHCASVCYEPSGRVQIVATVTYWQGNGMPIPPNSHCVPVVSLDTIAATHRSPNAPPETR